MPTVLHRLSRWADIDPDAPAQGYKKEGRWKHISVKEYRDRIYHLALFLESRGMTSKDIGCILGFNSPQWVHMDLAVLLLGGKSTGIYPNSTPKEMTFILNHTEAKVLGVQNKSFYEKILEGNAGKLPSHVALVIFFESMATLPVGAVAYETALTEGRKIAKEKGSKKIPDYLENIDPHSGAFMIYTSGTTGNPKGAMVSHDNMVFTADAVSRHWRLPMASGSLFSFLPLCHIAERLQNVGVGISQHFPVNFATKMDAVSAELPEVQPKLLLSVPRLWEKMMETVLYKIKKMPDHRRKLATWALGVGAKKAEARYSGKYSLPTDYIQYLAADRLVLSKIRNQMGLGQSQALASGAAALAPHISKWFRCLGLEILEDYGQTESTGVVCMTEPGIESLGTVGKPVKPIEVEIAEDGEILCRGRNVFKGYYKDEAATTAALEGGWLRTGDLGEITEQGLIKIRGRKKEILKTSGGKMIAPLPIEESLKASEMISQVCLVGDGRKYISALITLNDHTLGHAKLKEGLVIKDPEILAEIKKKVDEMNANLASYEQIKKFSILSREFSISDGEMTPTLKMKRAVIESRFKDVINQMYSGPEA
ncbi:MAG: long-chain fatty acid--CoA ligase [Bdellovibrionota bacterium]